MTLASATTFRNAVAALAPGPGRHATPWPRMEVYRYDEPQEPAFESVESLSLCVVTAGRKSVSIGDASWQYDPMNYLVLTRDVDFHAHILTAQPQDPFLSLILQIEPAVVRRVVAETSERTLTTLARPRPGPDTSRPAFVSPFDGDILDAVARFLQAVGSGADRRVLGPLYLHEIVYRLLQADQRDRLLHAAAAEDTDPVAVAARYMRENLAKPLTVMTVAETVNMSESAFAHLFKEITGTAPYQFLQQARLERARVLLASRTASVSEIARAVGYTSPSHFAAAFRRRYGTSPRSLLAHDGEAKLG
jgi:AraC-like DNA-binding protein